MSDVAFIFHSKLIAGVAFICILIAHMLHIGAVKGLKGAERWTDAAKQSNYNQRTVLYSDNINIIVGCTVVEI